MKNRKWGYMLGNKAMNVMAAMALFVTVIAVNRGCMWFLGQDELPKGAEKLRRF